MGSVNLTTHVSGLASGMDTEKIVSDMMKVNRIPLDKLEQAKTLNSWKTDAYREINTKIAGFRDAMQDLRLQGTFNAQKVTSSDASVDVSMAGASTQTNFTISAAGLAKPAKNGSVSFDTKIVNGSDLIDPTKTAANDVTFKLNGIDITVPKTSTFDQAVAQINSYTGTTNVKVSNVGGSLVFNTIGVGTGNSITITGSNNETNTLLKVVDGTTNTSSSAAQAAAIPPNLFAAQSYTDGIAAVSGYAVINGTTINISNNTFTYNGVQINLKQDILATGSVVAVNIVSDTDKIFDKMKTFVDKYNELVKDLNDKIGESKNRDYPPLTDAQKKDMKDTDITMWETKAKSGLLANDPTIRQFLTQLRTSMSETIQTAGINTSFDSLQEIGITTSTNYKDNGKLTLDETKLKSLLTSNMNDIQKMFSNKFDTGVATDTTVTSSTKYKNSGFAFRVYDRINDSLSKLTAKAGSPGTISINSDLAKEASSINERIVKVQDRLNTQEQALWTKFNAMESALQKLNSQSSWLTQQLGQ